MKGRTERIKMKRTIRKKMIAAAAESMDQRVFGYPLIVQDPQPLPFMDSRRKAHAQVDFEEETITISFFDPLSTDPQSFELGKCRDRGILQRLVRLNWHPTTPIDAVLEGAQLLFDMLQNSTPPPEES